jgi:hypothetical protein
MIQLVVSEQEAGLLEDIQEIGYGELYDIALPPLSGRKVTRTASRKAQALLKTLRRGVAFEKVVIHDSQPTAAEYRTQTEHGRSCLKKLRF